MGMISSPFFLPMSNISIFLLILFAAFLHASWNIIIKSINNSQVAIALQMLIQSIIFFPVLFFVPLPEGITWIFLILSLLLHSSYFLILGNIYNRGDITITYPVFRGLAPVFVTIFSVTFLNDYITFKGYVGISIVVFGLLLLAKENYKNKLNLKLLIISIFVSILIALYTFSDGAGVRSAKNEFTFIVWNFFLGGWITISYVYLTQKNDLFKLRTKQLALITVASFMSFIAYGIIIWSMNHQPIAYVSSIRESSIIMTSLISFIFLGEKIKFIRILSAVIFFIGVYFIFNS